MAKCDEPRVRLNRELGNIREQTESDDLDESTSDAILEVIQALDPDDPSLVFHHNGTNETKTPATCRDYAQCLRITAQRHDTPLLDETTDGINSLMASFAKGTHPDVKDSGYSGGTMGRYQSALIAFYRYHDGHDVDPDRIHVTPPDDSKVDERDIFTESEIEDMRMAIEHPRNRCLFELLCYTGQRVRAIQTLRVKDVEPANGIFYLNTSDLGLKGADGKRPLLGAKEYVRQWLEYHPTGEPDDYLITPLQGASGNSTPGEMLGQNTIRRTLRKIADRAGIDKRVHPHIFRHYFTTIAKRDYGLDDAMLKRLRGDSPGSNVMETTYSHLTDADAVEHAEAKFEGREPERKQMLSPEICPTCSYQLESGSKACSRCGSVFTPDAKAAKDEIDSAIWDSKGEAEGQQESDVDTLNRLLDENPDLEAKLVERVAERL